MFYIMYNNNTIIIVQDGVTLHEVNIYIIPLNPLIIILGLECMYSAKSINHCAPSGLTFD